MGESFTTNTACGGISSGTNINSNDTVQKLVKDMVVAPEPPSPPNDQYDGNSTVIATLNSPQDADNFFEQYNYQNGWAGLKLGNVIKIKLESSTPSSWVIAGFNMEHNQTAVDGTIYDNGYGICLIPQSYASVEFHNFIENNIAISNRVYSRSYYWTYDSTNVCSLLRMLSAQLLDYVLYDHLVSRNVLLRSSITTSTDPSISHFSWQKSYIPLITYAQTGINSIINVITLENGEANYKLPIFNYKQCKQSEAFLIRNHVKSSSWSDMNQCKVNSSGAIVRDYAEEKIPMVPMIYVR